MDQLAKIGLGTVQFGTRYGIANTSGQTPERSAHEILAEGLSLGIDTLDTASAYGEAEQVLGRFERLEEYRVVSKFIGATTAAELRVQLETSLGRLGLNTLYGYLAHRPLALVEFPGLWEALQNLKQEGLVQKTGYSLNRVSELEILLEKNMLPDLVQVPYNYLDYRFEPYFEPLKDSGCEIHTRSTFLQGLLLMPPGHYPAHFDSVRSLLGTLHSSCSNLEGSLLRFATDHPCIDKVILGVETREQLLANLGRLDTAERLIPHAQHIDEAILTPSMWPQPNP